MTNNICFNVPIYYGTEDEHVLRAIKQNRKISGDGEYTNKCNLWFENKFNAQKTLLTTSCTHALEMTAILLNIKQGDEIIAPSFTFVSTVNAFILRGAKVVFVDIRPDTMNIDEHLIEDAITSKTKAIIPVHYAGVACNMDVIMNLAHKYNLYVVEDSAQGVMAKHKDKFLGTIGDLGTYSFHETKNYSMGEGGALVLNNNKFNDRAEIIREKGTDRSKFYRGEIDKYSWVDIGSSYLPSDINAAYLYAQLEHADIINNQRINIWNKYNDAFLSLTNCIDLPFIPEYCTHNAHMYYIKTKDLHERTKLIAYLKSHNIGSVFHYIPLHTSKAGLKYSRFNGKDIYTTKESERLLRLPIYHNMNLEDVYKVISHIKKFYKG